MIKDEEEMIKKDKQGRFPDEDDRYRTYLLILYPDSTSYDYDQVINTLKGEYKYYAYIEHEPEHNELKKHTHVIIHSPNGMRVGQLAKKLGVPYNYFQVPLSLRGCRRYLTHIDYPEKIQYDLQFVNVSKSYMKTLYQAFDDEKIDIDILNDIYQFIDDNKDLDRIDLEKQLTLFVCSSSYNRIFKCYYSTIVKYIADRTSNHPS